jgi:disulfide bond formation protein DsbB
MKLYFAWLIALGGLLLSIYYGEVVGAEPCRLCWYQRMAILPLALFLGIAAFKNDRQLALYTLPLVAFGAIFALYQTLIAIIPSLHSHALCGSADHCTLPVFTLFGFLTFPMLSLFGFLAIALFIKSAKQ